MFFTWSKCASCGRIFQEILRNRLSLTWVYSRFYPWLQLFHSQSTYVCRLHSSVWRLPKYWPPRSPPPFHPANLSSPRTKGGGVHTRWAVREWGSIFWKTPDIGLASYSIIPLRFYYWTGGSDLHSSVLIINDWEEAFFWPITVCDLCTAVNRGKWDWMEGGNPRPELRSKDLRLNTSA